MKQTVLSLLVENTSGVLSRVAGLFSRRGYNIDSLTVGVTKDPNFSRMTVAVTGDDQIIEQIKKQLNRMVEVIKVMDLTDTPTHMKEILYVKVLNITPEERAELFEIAQVFMVDVVDIGADSVLLECKLKERKNNELIALLKSRFKRINVVRGGAVAIEAISTRSR